MRAKKEIIVMKFGGTSVGDTDKIKRVAERVIKAKEAGNDVVVVVSAMGKTTDELIDIASKISLEPNRREMDMLLATGEQVSIALLSMAIQAKGYECVSLTGSQAGILTDEVYSNAKILNINNTRIMKEIRNGNIVIVAGFQGITTSGDIATLGRGGSDTTAVAVAAALDAKYCEIYTDVDGVFSTDPNIVIEAGKIGKLSYEEMLELASSGAKVLHLRAVEFAKKHSVVLHVRSSFNDNEGTWVMDDSKITEKMERPLITGVTYDMNEVKVSVFGLKDIPGIASKLFGALAAENINVDLIVQNVSERGIATISYTIKTEDINLAKALLDKLKETLGFLDYNLDPDVAKVSIVGAGMQTHPGVAARMFEVLANNDINIEMISTSPIRISCVIRKDKVKVAVKTLHNSFKLDN
ncbi:MAG: aspartate kinase [Actinobacteria bacterium]|nr:aspartate kinase [Actinomycetota bacterium]